MNPEADTLRDAALARDLSWHAAIAAHSDGIACMYIVFDPEDGSLHYGLMRTGVSEHTRMEGNDG
jgi:hypothetical protein